jgi:hypothetical protein
MQALLSTIQISKQPGASPGSVAGLPTSAQNPILTTAQPQMSFDGWQAWYLSGSGKHNPDPGSH